MLHFLDGCKTQRAAGFPAARRSSFRSGTLAELGDPLGQARHLARGGVLVDDAAGHAARDFRLNSAQRFARLGLLSRIDGRLDRLDEGADAAHARMVDGRAIRVAADSLLGLRRIRHSSSLSRLAQ